MDFTAIDRLPDPADRLEALAALRDELEAKIEQTVREARANGYAWLGVGGALGTSRQAAFERYGKRPDMDRGPQPAAD